MNTEACDARFGWRNVDRGDWIIVDCRKILPHPSHSGPWMHNYPGTDGVTVITWLEDDRRTFRGDFVKCPYECLLPSNHAGNHSK